MKVVIAKIQVIEGTQKEYLALVAPLIEASRAEAGNLCYILYQDVQDSTEFMVYEEYVNEEAFTLHSNSEAFKSFVQNVSTLLAKDIIIKSF